MLRDMGASPIANAGKGVINSFQAPQQGGLPPQPSQLSRYMPLIVIGGLVLVGIFFMTRRK